MDKKNYLNSPPAAMHLEVIERGAGDLLVNKAGAGRGLGYHAENLHSQQSSCPDLVEPVMRKKSGRS
jgi:hypothetical protein